MELTAQSMYGSQPVGAPLVEPNGADMKARKAGNDGGGNGGGGNGGGGNGDDSGVIPRGDRAVLLLVVLIGAAIAFGWLSVYGGVRVGE